MEKSNDLNAIKKSKNDSRGNGSINKVEGIWSMNKMQQCFEDVVWGDDNSQDTTKGGVAWSENH